MANPRDMTLRLIGSPAKGDCDLTLVAIHSDGTEIGRLQVTVSFDSILGNVAIFNNFVQGRGKKKQSGQGSRYRFSDWSVAGDAFTVTEANRFGPILWSMYSLSDSRGDEGFVMKLSALTGPLGERDNKDIELWVQKNGQWESLGTQELDPHALSLIHI